MNGKPGAVAIAMAGAMKKRPFIQETAAQSPATPCYRKARQQGDVNTATCDGTINSIIVNKEIYTTK